jgi:hypothetical protein
MTDSISERQAERRRNERVYGSWPAIRDAIIAARGAKECSDVAAEEDGQQNAPLAVRAALAGPNPPPVGAITLIDALFEDKYRPESES